MHYCEECGKKLSSRDGVCFDDNLDNLLDGLLKSRNSEVATVSADACEFCGTTLKEIRKNNSLGCPNCYELFSDAIENLSNHPDNDYKKTTAYSDTLPGIRMLRKELEDAVRQEDFERAASIRDKILDREKEGFLSDD